MAVASCEILSTMKRIGIYAGTFDPVHVGHVTFALQAVVAAHLDMVYFMPEREPRHKVGTEHYGHRYAMLKRAVRPHAHLDVLDSTDKHFGVMRTLPRLRQHFPGDELVLLMGSDVARYLPQWPHVDQLVRNASFCVGLRATIDRVEVEKIFASLSVPAARLTIIESYAADISSSSVRQALQSHHMVKGLLTSVYKYAQKEWLYL